MTFEETSDQFVNWLKENGVKLSPKISLHDYRSEGQGRGIIAVDDIEKDEVLFTVPRDSVLAVDNDQKFSTLVSGDDDFGIWLNLMAYMMVVSNYSGWGPYYNMLPNDFNTPMFWTDKQIEMLQGSTLKEKIGKRDAEQQYYEAIKPFLDTNSKEFESTYGAIDNTLDAFHRMGSIIMAYSFDVKQKGNSNANKDNDEDSDEEDENDHVKAMVPMADMLNAHTRLCNAHLCHTDDNRSLQMRTIKKIPKGEQVYNTYGELPNSDLLRRYGYVESGGTEFDVVEIGTRLMAKIIDSTHDNQSNVSAESIVDELEVDEENMFYDDGYDIPVSGEPDLPNLVILVYLQLLVDYPKETNDLSKKRLFKAIANLCQDDKLTQGAIDHWEKIISARLKDYPIEYVNEAKENPDPEPKDDVIVDPEAMCKEVLLGEIRILLRSIKWSRESVEVVTPDSILTSIKKRQGGESTNQSNKKQKK